MAPFGFLILSTQYKYCIHLIKVKIPEIYLQKCLLSSFESKNLANLSNSSPLISNVCINSIPGNSENTGSTDPYVLFFWYMYVPKKNFNV